MTVNINATTRALTIIKLWLVLLCIISHSCTEPKKTDRNETHTNDINRPHVQEDTIEVLSKTKLELYLDSMGLVDIKEIIPDIQVDLKYAGTDNFTGDILYTSLNTAYLHPIAAQKLKHAQALLKARNPELSLLVYDATRPLSVQKTMYDLVKNTKYKAYVADPSRTGLHNYGLAVDLTICDSTGTPLDMGTKFDYFGKMAGIRNEAEFVEQGLLSQLQVDNRILLRQIMQQAEFQAIKGEWWHFNALPLSKAKQQATLIK